MPPTIHPTGTTIYESDKCWGGYSIIRTRDAGAVLIDMNGNIVNQWKNMNGFPGPNKILPGGYLMGSTTMRNMKYGYQDNVDVVQVDWDGNIVWKFDKLEHVRDPHRKKTWMARHHHDYQREGNPVGYYVPGMEPLTDKGNTIILCHKNVRNSKISEKELLDDVIIEVSWDGEIIWEWNCNEHFEELEFSEEAKNVLARNPNSPRPDSRAGDWMHLNSTSLLGPNKWFDSGDKRFNPENIIWSSRQSNILAIIDKKSGELVWKIGPDYSATPALRKMNQIVGPHNIHMIPRGLPGEGNLIVYDNGGRAGYGAPNPASPTGLSNATRDHSRILEFDPVTLEVVWQYPKPEAGPGGAAVGSSFYSSFMSSMQRLVNGNTVITEGATGRLFEVTPEGEIVWEYICPLWGRKATKSGIYRSYRVPYEWVPQLEKPKEKSIPRMNNRNFRVPGSTRQRKWKVTMIK
ncbi:aryl-sulfate sulfotransferase [Chloroflexota bacterium]